MAVHVLAGVACAYDWLYDKLTPEQRTLVRNKLANQAAVMHAAASVHLKKSSWWQETFFQSHNWVNNAGLGLAGWALEGEFAEAADWVAQSESNARAVLAAWSGVTDGSDHEGYQYWSYGLSYLLLTLDQMKRRGTSDPFADSAWLRAAAAWRLHGTMPRMGDHLGVGDCIRQEIHLADLTGDPRYPRDGGPRSAVVLRAHAIARHGSAALGRAFELGRVLGSADLGQHGLDPRILPSLGALGPDLPAGPQAARSFALGLWNHQIANPKTGAFDRHAPNDQHGPVDGKDFPRHAAFYIHTWAYAYKYTQEDVFLTAIETELARYDRKRRAKNGAELATLPPLDLETAASLVPEPLCSRLHAFADREDQLILADLHKQYARLDSCPISSGATNV